ncbi:MAG: hypothetical protein IPN24_00200 [Betaproteobacteria bacterium]|nr:hypothetical protein [Betaproteobacteria bacterium]
MDETTKKSGKRRELSLGQIKAIASDIAQALVAAADDSARWREFSQLPPSERRKVVDLLPPGIRDAPLERLTRLARATLSGGVATKHEAALKSVADLCARASIDDSRRREYLRQLLADLIDPAPLKVNYALPALGELESAEVAEVSGLSEAFGSLFVDPIPALGLRENVHQWARLLGSILVGTGTSRSFDAGSASAVLELCRAIPLKSRPLELRLSEQTLEVLANEPGVVGFEQEARLTGAAGESVANVHGKTQAPQPQVSLSVGEVLDLLQRTIAALEREQDHRRNALAAKITSLEGDAQREKLAYRDLEERCNRLAADLQRMRDDSAALRMALSNLEIECETTRVERDRARRELALVGGISTTSVETAKTDVRKDFIRLTLLPLQSVCAFAERLRANPMADNPDLLIVPLRTIVQVLHRQGFVTEADIPKL